jgi:hypothetical protein
MWAGSVYNHSISTGSRVQLRINGLRGHLVSSGFNIHHIETGTMALRVAARCQTVIDGNIVQRLGYPDPPNFLEPGRKGKPPSDSAASSYRPSAA